MPCHYPVPAFRLESGGITWNRHEKGIVADLKVPCGKCLGCKLEKSRQWASRCMHEASLYDVNSFVTLTYSEENLPSNGDLRYRDFQLFMKRLRKHFGYRVRTGRKKTRGTFFERKIRFYMCGEYGEDYHRPHFHACLFNVSFDDRVLIKERDGVKLYTSPTLEKIWGKGHVTIGDVTWESAAYIARYVVKKQGSQAECYQYIDENSGEVLTLAREFTKMSLKPGIGYEWYRKYMDDLFPNDYCVVRGKRTKPPKYYFGKLKSEYPEMHEEILYKREKRGKERADDNTDERLLVKEECLKSRIGFLKRDSI